MIDKSAIDTTALNYYRKLKASGFSAYFVGGSVRDLLLGKKPKDFDIATNATPHQIKRVIPTGKIIGRRFRHVLMIKDGGRYEIVTFRGPIINPGEAPKKQESDDPKAPKYPDLNQFGNAEQDAKRRDFTINALFYDPDANELVDYVGGKSDVDQRVVRAIGEANARMNEDPIRILRAIRHKIKLDLKYENSLENAMRSSAEKLKATSKDRIREEFLKVCNDQSLGDFLEESKSLGILDNFAPWLNGMSKDEWSKFTNIWTNFAKSTHTRNFPNDLGVSLLMLPMLQKEVLDPYAKLPEDKKNSDSELPNMRYFLNAESIRNSLVRDLRISKMQADTVLRAFYYFTHFTGPWLEEGPPEKTAGKLGQHISAVIAAWMSRYVLEAEGKTSPEWLVKLAECLGYKNKILREKRKDNSRSERSPRSSEGGSKDAPTEEVVVAHPILTEPLVWNGPLHAPSLKPIFEDDAISLQKWKRKNKSSASRLSGIPLPPNERAQENSMAVKNYKPEFETPEGSTEDDIYTEVMRKTADTKNKRRPQRGNSKNYRSSRRPYNKNQSGRSKSRTQQ